MTPFFSLPSRRQGPIFIASAPRSGATTLQYRLHGKVATRFRKRTRRALA